MTPKTSALAYLVVGTQCVLAIICVGAICAAMFYKNYSDPATLSALFLLTGTIVGNLGSILGGPRAMMQMLMKTQDVKVVNDEKKGETIPVETQTESTQP